MSHCLNPTCQRPTNPTGAKFCQTCGHQILLQGRYYPLKLIGKGAFGRTLLAEDHQKPSQPRCVIKQFFPDPINVGGKATALFHDEAVRLEQLGSHPQIPDLYAHCEQAGFLYIVQEFIDGQTLAAELKDRGAFPEAAIRQLLQSLLPVLDFIHQHQIIHRDIKPENIIRRRTDNQLVLVDFGAAKHATVTALAKTGTTIGSAGYAAREQSFGKAVYASDLYSLGVTCLHLLTQVAPFDLYDSLESTFVWRQFLGGNTVSDALGTILDKMVQERVSERYPSATAILQALSPKPQPQSSPPPSTPLFAPAPPPSLLRTPHPARSLPSLRDFQFATAVVEETLQVIPGWFGQKKAWTIHIQRIPGQMTSYYPEDLGNGITLDMVRIPGGSFDMGSNQYDSENPIHRVTVPAFFMGKYPITQAQYQAIMGKNPANFKGANRPVEQVSWKDAVAFCQKLSQKTGWAYGLPSEAEWEYACRADTTTPFHFGATITPDLVNYDGNYPYGNAAKGEYREQTTEVGSFPSNAFGLYDLHGNVWEWCADNWHANYNGAPTDGSIWKTSNFNNDPHLLRGGSWGNDAGHCRSAYRGRYGPGNGGRRCGFRVVSSSSAWTLS